MYDANALERLLGMIRPEMRGEVLRHFQRREGGERLGMLVELHDPALQAVLEEVWAPWWDRLPDEVLNVDDGSMIPGRRIAQARRAARRRAATGSEP